MYTYLGLRGEERREDNTRQHTTARAQETEIAKPGLAAIPDNYHSIMFKPCTRKHVEGLSQL